MSKLISALCSRAVLSVTKSSRISGDISIKNEVSQTSGQKYAAESDLL